MSNWRKRRVAWSARSASLLIGLLSAFSSAAQADDAAPATLPRQELREVIVTAQKREQTLEQVPASVTSLDGDFIRAIGARDFVELQNYSANTNIEASSSSGQLLIRGLGTLNDVPGLDPSVGTVIDGVPYSYSNYLSAFFTDLAHFEVLRGPQGTLFGKNTSAGLLNISSNAPDPHERLFKWDVTARSYGSRSFQPVINLPLGGGFAVRASGNFDHGDHGTLYNTDLDRAENAPQQDTGRVRLHYDAPDGWTMDLGAFWSQQQNHFNLYQLVDVSPSMAALAKHYDPKFESKLDSQNSEDVPSQEKSIVRGVNLTFGGDLGQPLGMNSLKITSISGYAENIITARDLDGDFSPIPFIRDSLVDPQPERQVTQELRVTGVAPDMFGLGGEVNFVTGVYYDNYTLKTSDNFQIEDLGAALSYLLASQAHNQAIGVIGGPLADTIDTVIGLLRGVTGNPDLLQQSAKTGLNQRTKDYAYFGQFEWSILQDWYLIGGVRYGFEDRTADAHSQSPSVIIKAVAKQQDFSEELHRSESDFSPKAGFKWQPNKRTEAYFTWARGYKSGGFNGFPLNTQSIEYGPENASSFELGLKWRGRLLDGPIRVSTSGFYTDLKNLQVSTFQGTEPVVVNAAAARSRGVENDVLWLLPVRGLSFFSSVGFADARYSSYPDGPVPGDYVQPRNAVGNQNCGPPNPNAASGTTKSCSERNLTGQRLPFAPRITASMVPAYTAHLPYALSTTFAVDVLYQGSRYLNSEDDARELQPATTQLNTRLVLADDARGDWALTLAANNLTREVIQDQIIDQPLAPGNFGAIRIDRGRYYTANLSVSFH
ncbi:MAG: TonB-dependent receptor [Nevskia sp.]|nr:TonB-dependent receptor [Nevskia sp.]